jgi:hypothetical protein
MSTIHRLIGWLLGCSHARLTFPLTLPRNGRKRMYVACLACGREFGYDWATMRLARGRTGAVLIEIPEARR